MLRLLRGFVRVKRGIDKINSQKRLRFVADVVVTDVRCKVIIPKYPKNNPPIKRNRACDDV